MPASTTLAHFSSHHHREERYEERLRRQRYVGHAPLPGAPRLRTQPLMLSKTSLARRLVLGCQKD